MAQQHALFSVSLTLASLWPGTKVKVEQVQCVQICRIADSRRDNGHAGQVKGRALHTGDKDCEL